VSTGARKAEAAGIIVGGLTPLSTADWPERLAAVVFCQGCAWNCPYCHNAALRRFGPGERPWPEVLAWLNTRRGLLDAVVFSGGEPLLQPGLAEAMRQVRGLGFEIGLHTGGMPPQALERALPLTDWIGLDVKAPRAAYERITGVPKSADAVWTSLALLRESGVAFELRTTWHPAFLSEDELLELAGEITASGALLWAIQAFQPEGCADAALAALGRAQVSEELAARLQGVLGAGTRLMVRR
jgi:pyruvate formate lyase activating enzyme